jgi:hypothetical protein
MFKYLNNNFKKNFVNNDLVYNFAASSNYITPLFSSLHICHS